VSVDQQNELELEVARERNFGLNVWHVLLVYIGSEHVSQLTVLIIDR